MSPKGTIDVVLCAVLILAFAGCAGSTAAEPDAGDTENTADTDGGTTDNGVFPADSADGHDSDQPPDDGSLELDGSVDDGEGYPDESGATEQDPGEDGPAADGDTNPDAGDEPVEDRCTAGLSICTGAFARRYCAETPSGTRWRDETCPSGQGCVAGICVAGACSDECNLGDSVGGQSCEELDAATGDSVGVDPAASMHDRARAYEMWLRRDGLYFGGVSNAIYSDPPDYTSVVFHGGMGDSAIWTGTYLAAESLRLMATGSADARAQVERLVRTLHLWFNVSGDPGVLARWVAPAGQSTGTELDCSNPYHHCNVEYDGQYWDYLGDISRDQYQGVMLGYALAYEALGEAGEETRALIRQDVVEFVNELMRERTVPLKITWNGTDWPIQQVQARFMVLCTREMTPEGAVHIELDTSDFNNSKMSGFQEFIPNLGDLVSQITGFGWLTNIPRADSAIMLSSFFRVAMLVTEGIPGHEDEYQRFRDYYYGHQGPGGNVYDWLQVADGWFYNDQCGAKYYANNIAMEPMFNWVRLEDDAQLRSRILSDVLGARMWPEHGHTKNSFFLFIYHAADPSTYADAARIAAEQLAGFPPPPRVKVPRDWRNDSRYQPHEPGCTDQVIHSKAVDVADRVVSDFIWQRNPWQLYDEGVPQLTFPGVDYLVAYWLGRWLGAIPDDTPGRCLAWR